jgi:hypothetical protein
MFQHPQTRVGGPEPQNRGVDDTYEQQVRNAEQFTDQHRGRSTEHKPAERPTPIIDE